MFQPLKTPEFPDWAVPGPFGKPQKIVLAEGEKRPNGEPAIGHPHPRGWGGDMEWRKRESGIGWHVWSNYPDPIVRRTEIAYASSLDGVTMTTPRVVARSDRRDSFGLETPSSIRMPGRWYLHSALDKRKMSDSSRMDVIRFFRSQDPDFDWEPLPDEFTLTPKFDWERRYLSSKTGKLTGGRMDQSLLLTDHPIVGPIVVCAWIAQSYAGRNKPSVGIAYLPLDGTEARWVEHPAPIIWNAGQIHLVEVENSDDRGYLAIYQNNPGSNGQVDFRARFSRDLLVWSDDIVILPKPEGFFRIVGPCYDPAAKRLWWWAEQEKGGDNSWWTSRADS